jgi:hypothetical protein
MARTVPQEKTVTGWVGWIMFAAYFMIIGGVFDIMQGLAALFRDQSYFVVAENGLLTFNFTSWGWIHLLFGLAMIGVGVLLLRGSTFARIIAILVVGLNMVSQFAWLAAYPVWGIIALVIDALILYALLVHGREMVLD